MNLYSVATDALRRFVARHQAPRVVNQTTYVFFLVPFDFSKNGETKQDEVPQSLINGHSDFDLAVNYTPCAPLALGRGEIRALTTITTKADVADEPQLDFRLMWTWFLPNPFWKPKQRS